MMTFRNAIPKQPGSYWVLLPLESKPCVAELEATGHVNFLGSVFRYTAKDLAKKGMLWGERLVVPTPVKE